MLKLLSFDFQVFAHVLRNAFRLLVYQDFFLYLTRLLFQIKCVVMDSFAFSTTDAAEIVVCIEFWKSVISTETAFSLRLLVPLPRVSDRMVSFFLPLTQIYSATEM